MTDRPMTDAADPEPDFVYDPDGWEVTYHWSDRHLLTDELLGELWEPRCFRTLISGPDRWAAEIVLTRDDEGDPDETEIQWFDSLEDAQAAIAASQSGGEND